MVKGTIKEVQLDKNVLIVNQKVKNESVDRELSIEATTEFVVTIKGSKKEGTVTCDALLELCSGKAVEMTIAGPRSPKYVRTKCADENMFWVYR